MAGNNTDESGAARFRRRMAGRDRDEEHRPSTPLELLVDLCFVVAVAQVAAELHHAVAEDHLGAAVVGYLSVFFAIWWAWMNFTWFASAFDVDDLPYRLLTLMQMAGILVLAAGVPAAFEQGDFVTITIGYVIMRIALVAQWLRVAADSPASRGLALRYSLGVSLLQIGWIGRLFLPDATNNFTFVLLVIGELAVPIWAERAGSATPWHPGHIAERYGLFTIIVLGESILAGTITLQAALTETGLSWSLIGIAAGSLVLIFGMWWCYFARSAEELRPVVAALAVAIPLALFLAMLGVLQTGIDRSRPVVVRHALGAGAVLTVAACAGALTLPGTVLAMAVAVSVLVGLAAADRPA